MRQLSSRVACERYNPADNGFEVRWLAQPGRPPIIVYLQGKAIEPTHRVHEYARHREKVVTVTEPGRKGGIKVLA